jgi:hypothetical protein
VPWRSNTENLLVEFSIVHPPILPGSCSGSDRQAGLAVQAWAAERASSRGLSTSLHRPSLHSFPSALACNRQVGRAVET